MLLQLEGIRVLWLSMTFVRLRLCAAGGALTLPALGKMRYKKCITLSCSLFWILEEFLHYSLLYLVHHIVCFSFCGSNPQFQNPVPPEISCLCLREKKKKKTVSMDAL